MADSKKKIVEEVEQKTDGETIGTVPSAKVVDVKAPAPKDPMQEIAELEDKLDREFLGQYEMLCQKYKRRIEPELGARVIRFK